MDHIRHDDYDDQLCCGYSKGERFYGVTWDFLLLKLDGESTKQVVTLETSSLRPASGQELYVVGFGDVSPDPDTYVDPDRLHEVSVNYLSNVGCAGASIYPLRLLPDDSMCAVDRREDACQGDSGGPLVQKGNSSESGDDVQVGVVSWGWGCAAQPGVYARVSEGYGWIREQVCEHSSNPPPSFGCSSMTGDAGQEREQKRFQQQQQQQQLQQEEAVDEERLQTQQGQSQQQTPSQ